MFGIIRILRPNCSTMKKIFYFPVVLMVCLSMTSCSEDKKSSGDVSEVEEQPEDTTANDGDFEESEEQSFIMPSPMQVADLLNSSGLVWSDGLTNDLNNVSKYTSEMKKAINFGVYSMDLAYAVLNNRSTESQSYLKAVRELALETGLDEIFNSEDLVNRFEANLGNKDSIFPLLFEIHERTEMVLDNNDDRHKTVIHFAGAWLEGMFLGTRIATDKNNTELGTAVVNQMVILENMIKGLEGYPGANDELKAFAAKLNVILDTYYNFESVKSNADKDYLDPTLTDKELNILKEKVVSLRTEIVTI